MEHLWKEKDFLSCCGSKRLAREMAAASPFADLDHAPQSAREIWFSKIGVNGWLEAFHPHPTIGVASPSFSRWSKEEQSTALATATDSTMEELVLWNARYREKFGFVFVTCASGRGTPEILGELKKRYLNKTIIEFEIAAKEEMKLIELHLAKLFETQARTTPSVTAQLPVRQSNKPRGGVVGGAITLKHYQGIMSNIDVEGPSQATSSPDNNYVLDEAVLENLVRSQGSPTFSQGEFENEPLLQHRRMNQDPISLCQCKRDLGSLKFDRQCYHPYEVIESRNTATSALREEYSIRECIHLLNEMSDMQQGSELHMFALDVFLKKKYRELFIALGLPKLQLAWLSRQQKLASD